MKWENNYDLSCKILKDPKLFTFPPVTKYITKENKDYDEENKFFQLNSNDEIILDSQKKESTSLSKINYSFNFMRNTFIIVDMSDNSILVDFKPNRIKYIFTKLIKFIEDYFSYNFISKMTIIINHNCTSEILSPMSNDPNEIIKNINSRFFNTNENFKFGVRSGGYPYGSRWIPGGYFSLYNSLEAIKELVNAEESSKNDVLIFNSSLLSYDNGVKNDFYLFCKEKLEINVVSLEVPYDALKELTKNTGGELLLIKKEEKNIYAYNTNSDLDAFLHNFACKFCKMNNNIKVENPLKLEEKNINTQDFNYFCFCHKKKQKIVYCCAKCGAPYCYIPFYCIKCSLINIDNTFLQLLFRAKKEDNKNILTDKKNICYPYKFQYFYDKYSNDETYIKNAVEATNELGKEYIKELQHITESVKILDLDYVLYPLHYQIKLLYFYLKYQKGKDKLYSDIKKNVKEKSYLDLIKDNKIIILKDYMKCHGCDKILVIRDKNDFDNIFIFSNCLDIFCLDCYKYLIKNNIGCLECTE